MKTIEVKRCGDVRHALVDNEDFDRLSRYSWGLMNGYAMRGTNSRGRFLMHREVMGLEAGDGLEVDHINRNRLDNRRENLRVVSRSTNSRNRGADRNSTSPFLGVSWNKERRRWIASASLYHKAINLGSFKNEIDAALKAMTWRHDHTPFVYYPEFSGS